MIEVPDGVNATFGREGRDTAESLTSATDETDRELNLSTTGTNQIAANGGDSDFRAASGDTAITGVIGMALAKNGAPATGNGPFGADDSCIFSGVVFG
jgi:hypothetical protein